MKIIWFVLLMLVMATVVYAGCRSYTIYGADGSLQICTECCDQHNNCTLSCV